MKFKYRIIKNQLGEIVLQFYTGRFFKQWKKLQSFASIEQAREGMKMYMYADDKLINDTPKIKKIKVLEVSK